MRQIPFGKPIIGQEEHDAIAAVLDTGHLVHGPKIKAFEEAFAAFCGAPYVVGVSSCTAGLHLSYFTLGIGPGDEVIVPAMTHTATAHAVEYVGATPRFVDAEPQTGNIDVELVAAAVNERTRAISVVHYLGLPADMHRINEIAQQHDLAVIEDCALSVGASVDGIHTGLLGTCGLFSFYPVKHMTTGEGGVLITTDEDLAAKVAHQRAFGVDRSYGERVTPGQYEVTALGFNYRMSELHAALGVEQLRRLPGFLEVRARNFRALTEGLETIDGIFLLESSRPSVVNSHYCRVFVLDDARAPHRESIIRELKARGVGTSIYYPGPVPLMSYYRDKYGCAPGDFPEACRISDQSIALPVGPHVDLEDVEYMITTLREVLA